MNYKTGPWRGLTAVFASLLALMIGAMYIVNANASVINSRLGTSNYVTINEDGEEVDANYFKSEFSSLIELIEAKNELAEQISEEGSVLFKNENSALPLDISTETVTLWGLNSHSPSLGGQIGSTAIVASDSDQVEYDLETALAVKGFTLNQTMIDLYSSDAVSSYKSGVSPSFGVMYENFSSYNVGEAPPSIYTDSVLASADGTAAIVVISRDSSEANDYHPDMENGTEGDSFERPLALSEYEKAMIELAKAHSTKVIVLINADNAMEIDELKNDDEIDAILWVGAPGVNGFLGVADVLSGEENPSGHISDTYAVNSASSPAMVNFGVYLYTNYSGSDAGVLTSDNKGDWYVVQTEGIYIGYKYYETRYEDSVLGQGNADSASGSSTGSSWSYASEVSYPFGYGLSYTTFEQTLESVEVSVGGTGTAVVTVTNTGSVAGKSVAQLYVQTPYTEGGLEKSAIQLVAYGKTEKLEPGESETLTITFDPSIFASYDETAKKADGTLGAWVLEEGDYYFSIGNGAHEALNNVLAKKTGSEAGLVKTADTDVINPDNVVVWNLGSTDIETYSENVENQLQDADINNLIANTAEYTTRSDWTKGWTAITTLTATSDMLKNLTNQIYTFTENGDGVTWGADNGLSILDMMTFDEDGNYTGVLDFDDPLWDDLLDQITLDEAIQFIEKGGDDVEDIASISLFRSYANDGPVGFAYDQVAGYYVRWSSDLSSEEGYTTSDDEGGTYSMATMPTEPVVAATFNAELVEREGELFGEDGIWSNESSLFAPGTNIHRTPYCARNHEYYSEDSVLTSMMSAALCIGGESKGLMMEAKHFALNNQEANRSGISTFVTEQGARENELRCFQYIMSENLTAGVMTAFNRIGTTYAGAYSNLLINIARNEWGYMGWFNTDMINGADYMNWRDVTAAGGGNALTSSAYDTSSIGTMAASKSVIEKDTYFQEMMKFSLKFWMYQLADSNSMNGQTANTQVKYVLTWYQKAIYAVIAVLALLTLLCLFFTIRGSRKRDDGGNEGIRRGLGFYLMIIGIVVSILTIFQFGELMYRYTGVYYMLGVEIILGAIAIVLPFLTKNKVINSLIHAIPVANAVLMASAFVWGTSLMVNQIGYVYSGLDSSDTIQSWIVFSVITIAGMILNIVAAFVPMSVRGEGKTSPVSKKSLIATAVVVVVVIVAVVGWDKLANIGSGSTNVNSTGTEGAGNATEADLPVAPEFAPNTSYDVYTVLEYTIEAIDADLVATVSANAELTEFEILCAFYGEDQYCTATYDGKEVTVTEDRSGFMTGDAPAIIEAAIAQNIWVPTSSYGGGGSSAGNANEADLPVQPEFAPNTSYDVYTVLEYTIEAIDAHLVATVSANEGLTEFEILCAFYGEDQYCAATYDGSEVTVTEDRSGFMTGDAPAIVEAAIAQNIWVPTSSYTGGGSASAGNATEADLPTAPEFAPNTTYDVYTVLEYTIESINADIVATVSANAGLTEFEIQCAFYGEDQLCTATYDGSEYTITGDKSGFMSGDTPAILDKAIDQDIWVPTSTYGGGGSASAGLPNATEADLPAAAEFEPNTDYDVYTVLEYTITSIGADIVATVSANDGLTEFEIQCAFYGEDQLCTATYDGSEYTITGDKSGFMSGDTPAILDAAIAQNIWVSTK